MKDVFLSESMDAHDNFHLKAASAAMILGCAFYAFFIYFTLVPVEINLPFLIVSAKTCKGIMISCMYIAAMQYFTATILGPRIKYTTKWLAQKAEEYDPIIKNIFWKLKAGY